ncbi:hypothetical protein ACOMCU_01000 [Lysinibacillus sp. UGB7]|uniref:hypothetical protein n=1 Tax=Lysinibacillus sp. UGB7 TaxID=3411039 RepID=UPI003B7D65BA
MYALCYIGLMYKAHKNSMGKKSISLVERKELELLTVGANTSYALDVPTYSIGKELNGEEILKRLLIVIDNARGQIKFERSDVVYNDLQFVLDFMKGLNEESLEDFVNFSAFHESVAIATISNSINKGVFTQDNAMLIYLLVEVSDQLKESRLRYIERHSKDMEEELSILKKTKDLNQKVIQY